MKKLAFCAASIAALGVMAVASSPVFACPSLQSAHFDEEGSGGDAEHFSALDEEEGDGNESSRAAIDEDDDDGNESNLGVFDEENSGDDGNLLTLDEEEGGEDSDEPSRISAEQLGSVSFDDDNGDEEEK